MCLLRGHGFILVEVRGEGHHGDRNMVANETFAGREERGTLLGSYCRTCRIYFCCDCLPDILTYPAVMPDPNQSNPEEQTDEQDPEEPAMVVSTRWETLGVVHRTSLK